MIDSKNKKTLFLGLLLIICFSRGLLQIIFPKNIAVAIQFVSILTFLFFWIDVKTILRNLINIKYLIIIIITIFSAILTLLEKNNLGIIWLAIVLITLLTTIYTKEEIINEELNYTYLKNIIICIYLYLILFAVLQSNGYLLIYLPADNSFLYRPSSVTSSYLHYPIIISVLSIIFLYIYINKAKGDKLFLILYLIGLVASFIASSRYGMLQVILGILMLNVRKRLISFFLILTFCGALCLFDESIKERLLGAISIDSIGNNDRISTWIMMLEKISPKNIVLGEHFGIYSNSMNFLPTFSSDKVYVTESSILLLILNFGVIGGIYYLYIIRSIYGKNFILFLILIIPSIFYQSIETIPFILLICLAPILIRME